MDMVLINNLIDQHGDTYLKCKGCRICDQIKKQAKERTPEEKFNHILAKGQDMTKSDIEFLLDNEVQRKVIRKALKMSDGDFFAMMDQLGLMKKQKTGVEEMAITLEKYQDFKEQGLTDAAIAKSIGVSQATLSYHRKKWFTEGEKQPKNVSAPKPLPSKKEVATNEYESLKAKLAEMIKTDENKSTIIEHLEKKVSELEHLHIACEDVEKEAVKYKEERNAWKEQYFDTLEKLKKSDVLVENQAVIIEKNNQRIERLDHENKLLKGFVKLCL